MRIENATKVIESGVIQVVGTDLHIKNSISRKGEVFISENTRQTSIYPLRLTTLFLRRLSKAVSMKES